MRKLLWLATLALVATPAWAAILAPSDVNRLRDVSDPQVSPDGKWVAYVVSTPDTTRDASDTHLVMTTWDGSRTVQLTSRGKESESHPRFSPDGRYIAFLSGRTDDGDVEQVWILDRDGGEAQKLTSYKGGVDDFVWSPDSKSLALIVTDENPAASTDKDKTKPPIVIDRYSFKRDVDGYLGAERQHLYAFDVATKTGTQLTTGPQDEALPAWSPDSLSLAYVAKHGDDADRFEDWDLFVIEAKAGAVARQLTTFEGQDNAPDWESYPAWSHDGTQIAYLQGGPLKMIEYATHALAVIPAAGGPAKVLTQSLDRNVLNPIWLDDGKSIAFLVEGDREQYVARVAAAGGAVQRVIGGRFFVNAMTKQHNGKYALLMGNPYTPPEVFAWTNGSLKELSHQNDWLSQVTLGHVIDTSFKSKDGTEVHGFLITPPNYSSGRIPTILRIHGGPVWQFDYNFQDTLQFLAAQGYAIVAANPRGSSGRGQAYSAAIAADWGNLDAQDVLAAVDDAVAQGVADTAHLGVGGWSYGGILTNYVIAQDTRFKAAVSGAGASNILAGYGTDQYTTDYDQELGQPWANTDTWIKLSFPFLHADRIKTPTLFMGVERDFNVPLLNQEQMYQALRNLRVPTQLVIYPDQYHEITVPSYLQDRLERYIKWYDTYLKDGHG
ncbi:MAG TPA: S9 family peptidase [Rhizomicrobium sp.]|nr:S9 family peptidase [Rhizomicrobium sp.]